MRKYLTALLGCLLMGSLALQPALAQKKKKNAPAEEPDNKPEDLFKGIMMRGIGPAFMSGRIADIAMHPEDDNVWYLAIGSGGLWKTENAGTTWQPLFDGQPSYSVGCITLDPKNPHTVWVGTGENVGGRHVGFGDGIYRSQDGGKSWENLGLKESEHISRIIVHPNDPNTVWVAAQGPLWSKGGQRGVFKTTDGGQTWQQTLGDAEWVGATDLLIDPRNPDRLYAATWQRHRTVAAYMGGGPGTAIYRSEDGGETWKKLENGLPKSNMGKIGLAISPQQPDVVYAAIELDRRQGAVYRSTNRGESWEKRSDAVSGATGPHYYQELIASPHAFDRLYLVDVRMQVSDDGGKTFRRMKEEHKHSDNHALVFRADDPDYLLVGTDGGLYESFDLAENWRYIANLPTVQYYKVAVDDREPFYHIYGGTQDNNTHGGPSRTDNVHGIRNADWYITLFGDGHQPATEPGNPDIMYSEWQEGNLMRIDRTNGEMVYIKPQPSEQDDYERFNWDAPILVSAHDPKRIYHASQRVWRSDNRGDTWTAISGDLTRNEERFDLPIMGRKQSWDNAWDVLAMSNYNTITSLAESPKKAGLLYAGTDDGLIHVTEDGGDNWRKISVSQLPGVPDRAFVNDLKADLHDPNTVYVALDNHKEGDYKPYLFKSTDKGQSWQSIAANLPDRHLVWRIVQDHEKPDLLFAATEFGIWFTVNGGEKWHALKGGVPTISFRDLAIQRRENDLVGASFGRGFYILDDYAPLREVSESQMQQEATLFPVRKAWWYIEQRVLGSDQKASQGAAYYTAPNPPFGATFTYYLKEALKTDQATRKEAEKTLNEAGKDIPFPGWDALEAEARQPKPMLLFTIRNEAGETVRRLETEGKKGFHRITWDLRYPPTNWLDVDKKPDDNQKGALVAPGKYTVSLSKRENGKVTQLAGPVSFEVVPLRDKGALPAAKAEEVAAFWKAIHDLQGQFQATSQTLSATLKRAKAMQQAHLRSPQPSNELDEKLHAFHQQLLALHEQLNGQSTKNQVGEKNNPSVSDRLSFANLGTAYATYGPTPAHRQSLQWAQAQHNTIRDQLRDLLQQMTTLETELRQAGAPWIEGQPLPGK